MVALRRCDSATANLQLVRCAEPRDGQRDARLDGMRKLTGRLSPLDVRNLVLVRGATGRICTSTSEETEALATIRTLVFIESMPVMYQGNWVQGGDGRLPHAALGRELLRCRDARQRGPAVSRRIAEPCHLCVACVHSYNAEDCQTANSASSDMIGRISS